MNILKKLTIIYNVIVDKLNKQQKLLVVIILVIFSISFIEDGIQIVQKDVYMNMNQNGDVEIVNSYKIQNPMIIIIYSTYVRFFDNPDNYLTGSVLGIYGEWIFHSHSYIFAKTFKSLGVDKFLFFRIETVYESSLNTFVGPTAFVKGRPKYITIISLGYQIGLNPISILFDIIGEI